MDVLPERIYQACVITYVVKRDPKLEEIAVRGFAVFHKRVGEERMARFDVYGDFGRVGEKVREVGT